MKKIIILFFISISISINLVSQNVGINSTGVAPNASAMLDVTSISKGLLAPRVALSSATDVTTISSPANSLLVFNTAAAGGYPNDIGVGYYYYSTATSRWTPFSNSRTYSVIGTTDVSTTVAAGGTLMPQMTITFIPINSVVYINFTAAGTVNVYDQVNVNFDIMNGATLVKEIGGNSGTAWNFYYVAASGYPITVTPGVSTTISVNWYRLPSVVNPTTMYNYASTQAYSLRNLTINDTPSK